MDKNIRYDIGYAGALTMQWTMQNLIPPVAEPMPSRTVFQCPS